MSKARIDDSLIGGEGAGSGSVSDSVSGAGSAKSSKVRKRVSKKKVIKIVFISLSDIPDWVSYDENVTPKRTKILTPLSVMVSLGRDFNDPSQRFEMPTQCGMSHLRPATLPLRGRNACAEPIETNSCCED